jgi:hypothetical protein
MHLTGIIYFPNSEVEFTGGSTVDAKSLLPEQYYARLVE